MTKNINQLREEASKFLSREMCEAILEIKTPNTMDLEVISALVGNEFSLTSFDLPWSGELAEASYAIERARKLQRTFDAVELYRSLREGAMESNADLNREERT